MAERIYNADFTLKQLMQAGVHFGHLTRKWNPKMAPYIYGVRNGVHIINLETTAPLLRKSLEKIYEVSKNNGKILFVGTKRQSTDIVRETAERCGQFYVNHRWLGGCITNWETVSRSITVLKDLRAQLDKEDNKGLTKKEILMLTRKRDKMELVLGGIDELNGNPDLVVVLDAVQDDIAVKEANVAGIPVVAVLDTNASPDGVDYPIPGNDDVVRAIRLYSNLMVEAILKGTQDAFGVAGGDIGEATELPEEAVLQQSSEEAATTVATEV